MSMSLCVCVCVCVYMCTFVYYNIIMCASNGYTYIQYVYTWTFGIRFGQVLWLSESKNAPSDEVLFQKHRIKDLERDGSVSVDSLLGPTNWCFVTRYACVHFVNL